MSRLDPGIITSFDPVRQQFENVQLSDLMAQKKEREAQTAFRLSENQRLQQQAQKDQAVNQAISEAGGQLFDDNGAEKPVVGKLRSIDPVKSEALISSFRKQWSQNQLQKIMRDAAATPDPDDPTASPLMRPGVRDKLYALDPQTADQLYSNYYLGLDRQQKAIDAQNAANQKLHNDLADSFGTYDENGVFTPNVTDDTDYQQRLSGAVNKLKTHKVPPAQIQEFLSELGPTYTDKTNQNVMNMHQEGLTTQQKMAEQSAQVAKKAKDVAEKQKWDEKTAQVLGVATTEPEWAAGINRLKEQGVSDAYLNALRLPGESVPDAAKRLNLQGMTPEQRSKLAEGKSETEEQLTAKALKGDKDAQAVLDAMQKRKIAIANAESANRPGAVQLVTHPDANGNLVQEFVPKEAGTKFAAKPTAIEQTRRDQANLINNYGNHIIQLIDKNPNAVGPILGRLARGEKVIGNIPPGAAELNTALGSLVALQPMLHGFRGGGQTVEHFNSVIGDQHINAAALKASIKEIQFLANQIMSNKAEVIGSTSPHAGKSDKELLDIITGKK